MTRKISKEKASWIHGYRSGLEETISKQLTEAGIDFEYEKLKIKYEQPSVKRTYTPDFELPNGIIIETKGRLILEDRKKHLWIKEQHPNLDIRFCFSNAKAKITAGSPTTYADWADKNGFKWCQKTIPDEWLKE
jgi:hypothetical protein